MFGGRWNSVGRAAVYTSSNRALAALELLIHVDPRDAPNDLMLVTITVPDAAAVVRADRRSLPRSWERLQESAKCRAIGDEWLETGRALALRVPSAVMPEEENVLLNPAHSEMRGVRVVEQRAFAFDQRLLG